MARFLTHGSGGKEWESNPPGTSRGPSPDLKSGRPAGVRVSSVCEKHVGVAHAAGEFYAIEILEHLDRDVAPELAAVAELGGSDRATHLRGELLQPFKRRRQEKAVLRHADSEAQAREARERGFEPSRFHADGGRELGDARRARHGEQRLDLLPQR